MRLSITCINADVNAVTARLDGGTLQYFSGAVPESAGGDPGSARLLAEMHFRSPAFHASRNGSAAAFPVPSTIAIASGRPTWLQAVAADGSVIFDDLVNQGEHSARVKPAWIEVGAVVILDDLAYEKSGA